jgi:5-methylcytosine-specific restriction endonuclease McrA
MAKLRKTPTEIKYEALLRQRRPKQSKKAKAKQINKKKIADNIAYRKNMPYVDFLKTRYWHEVRKLVLERDGKKCVICKKETGLQVHHDSYKNHGNELRHLSDLLTLCADCHKEHHDAQK